MRERDQGAKMSALGFEGCYHGSSVALAEFSHPNVSMKLGWPSVKYPESAAQEAGILEGIRAALTQKRNEGCPVAAIVIEPTNYHSGHVASKSFLSELTGLARES